MYCKMSFFRFQPKNITKINSIYETPANKKCNVTSKYSWRFVLKNTFVLIILSL